jgi:hypothetical protein
LNLAEGIIFSLSLEKLIYENFFKNIEPLSLNSLVCGFSARRHSQFQYRIEIIRIFKKGTVPILGFLKQFFFLAPFF